MSYDQYIALFADHIEGKAKNEREIIASDDENDNSHRAPSKKPVSINKPCTPKKDGKSQKEEDKE